jgi:RNA polymerase sigma-70 factor (ECF subfamily)
VHAQGGTSAQAELVQVPERPSDEAEGTPLGTWLEQRALDTIRAEFEDRTWAAFWQATVDGLTAAEIAADLGMSKEAVRQAKYRVLRRLRVELDGLLDD